MYLDDEAWTKKSTDDIFDVTMGSYDGVEICEFVGLLLLNKLSSLVDKRDTGLYRDDGLILLRNVRGRSTDKMRKKIIEIFQQVGFQIEIVTGLKSANFLWASQTVV